MFENTQQNVLDDKSSLSLSEGSHGLLLQRDYDRASSVQLYSLNRQHVLATRVWLMQEHWHAVLMTHDACFYCVCSLCGFIRVPWLGSAT